MELLNFGDAADPLLHTRIIVEAEQHESALVLDSGRFKLVYMGDQSLYKGMLRLIQAMDGVDADLFMVGTPNRTLQRLAPSNIKFAGTVSPQEVLSILRQADVLVNPSDQDSNFKLQEYVRAGRPILGVAGRMSWAFEHGKDAWLVDDLREGVIRLRDDVALRSRLVEGLKDRPVLTWEQVVRKLEEVLLKVVRD